jgi:transposase
MLTLSPAVRIYLATGATDLRRSIDGLSALVREQLALDPLSGHLFLFRNRRGDRLKILAWDHSGFWILYKRLERARLPGRARSGAPRSKCAAAIWRCSWRALMCRRRADAGGMNGSRDRVILYPRSPSRIMSPCPMSPRATSMI